MWSIILNPPMQKVLEAVLPRRKIECADLYRHPQVCCRGMVFKTQRYFSIDIIGSIISFSSILQ
jgi:hypothetical protein